MSIQMKIAPVPIVLVLSGVSAILFGLLTNPRNIMGWTLIVWGTGQLVESLGLSHHLWRTGERSGRTKSWKVILTMAGILAVSIFPPLDFLVLPALLPRTQWLQDAGLILCALGLLFLIRLKISWECLIRKEGPEGTISSEMHNEPDHANPFLEFVGITLWALGVCVGFGSLPGIVSTLLLLIPGLLPKEL
jgi:hypothetical protein